MAGSLSKQPSIMFAHPNQLYWGLLAIPLVVFAYWRRGGVPTEPVASFRIWSEVFVQDRFRSTLLRWRREMSLCMQLAILASIVLAAADPIDWPAKPWLIGLAAALAAFEWCLYQRRWTD
jgi:hypothetical protein